MKDSGRWTRARRERLGARGLCCDCAIRPRVVPHLRCFVCAVKQALTQEARNRDKRLASKRAQEAGTQAA